MEASVGKYSRRCRSICSVSEALEYRNELRRKVRRLAAVPPHFSPQSGLTSKRCVGHFCIPIRQSNIHKAAPEPLGSTSSDVYARGLHRYFCTQNTGEKTKRSISAVVEAQKSPVPIRLSPYSQSVMSAHFTAVLIDANSEFWKLRRILRRPPQCRRTFWFGILAASSAPL